MTNPNNWPGEPGYPLNPEREGAHRVRWGLDCSDEETVLWVPHRQCWIDQDGDVMQVSGAIAYEWQYLGPCIPLGEQYAAGYAEGAADARKADVEELFKLQATYRYCGGVNPETDDEIWEDSCAASIIEALPLPQSKPDQELKPSISNENTQPDSGESKPDQMSLADLMHWFGQQHHLRLEYHEPVLADDDQISQWWVVEDLGFNSVKERDIVGWGATPVEAIEKARKG